MSDSVWRGLTILNDRLDALQAAMTEGPTAGVAERYDAWRSVSRAALADLVVESLVERFDLVRGAGPRQDGRRPTPPVFLDAAASSAFLMDLRRDLETRPGAVLRLPPGEPAQPHPLGGVRKVVDLMERRLGKAFRGVPQTERDVQDGFDTLLAGAEIAYARETDTIVGSAGAPLPDFTFPDAQAALILKLCQRPGREQEIVAEIQDEIPAYRTKYQRIIFGVYDLGFIRNPAAFSEALQTQEGVWVRVIRHY